MKDRISSLSDELLLHILSFLPTQQAGSCHKCSFKEVDASLCTSVPVLNFNNLTYQRNDKPSYSFESSIYETLLARDVKQPITSFRLKYKFHDGERAKADVNVWVNTAIKRGGIENLEIELDFEPEIEAAVMPEISLSCRVFTCITLVVLKLGEVYVTASSSVELPSLKSLNLCDVTFVQPQCLMELLYGCPMLEDLNVLRLYYAHDGSLCKDRVKILPKLVRADIRLYAMDIMDGNSTNILLKAISNVEFMTITKFRAFRVYDVAIEFPHLRHLALSPAMPMSAHWALSMLKNCPKLQSFEFDGYFKDEDVILPYPQFVPECLTSCLTKCYLKRYISRECDLKFAKYMMQNSTYLRSMKIHSVSPDPLEMLKELALCPRKSASCELSFNKEVIDYIWDLK